MSVSEFRYGVYSGSVGKEWVDLDNELFLTDEGEGLWLSILKYYTILKPNSFQIMVFTNLESCSSI